MRDLIPPDWTTQLASTIESDEFTRLCAFVEQERVDYPDGIYPPAPEVFAALDLTPFDAVRAVILGMDPYRPHRLHRHVAVLASERGTPEGRPAPDRLVAPLD